MRTERIGPPDAPFAYVCWPRELPETTTFVTPPSLQLQLGFIAYPRDGQVPRHFHTPVPRQLSGTPEVLIVQAGRCEIDIYDDRRELVATRGLEVGDVAVLLGGGHGIRMLDDCVLMEVKQGPYGGVDEKVRF